MRYVDKVLEWTTMDIAVERKLIIDQVDASMKKLVGSVVGRMNVLDDFVQSGISRRNGVEAHILWICGGAIFIAGLVLGYVLG